MKKTLTMSAAAVLVAIFAIGAAGPASAQSANFAGKDCVWPTHAFLEITSKGTQELSVTASGGGGTTSNSWGYSATSRRHVVDSTREDATKGYAYTSWANWDNAGWGCSI